MTESTDPKTVATRRRVFAVLYSLWGAALVVIVLVLLIGGCGGSDAPAASSPEPTTAPAAADTVKVAALGDSITAGSPLWDPNSAARDQIGPALDEQSQFEYWASQSDPALDFKNCGVFGERTDEIALRLQDCAKGADALIIQGGINDIAQGLPPKAAAEALQAMVTAGKSFGIPIALVEVLPWNNGHPTADKPIKQLNAMIGDIGDREHVPVLPFYAILDDPDNPGQMPADLTIDGDHPSVAGYRLLGDEVVKGLRALDLP